MADGLAVRGRLGVVDAADDNDRYLPRQASWPDGESHGLHPRLLELWQVLEGDVLADEDGDFSTAPLTVVAQHHVALRFD